MALASEVTGWEADSLAVAARLLVSPEARRKGIGGALLTTAAAVAVGMGRWPIPTSPPASPLQSRSTRACGWSCAGEVAVILGDGTSLDEHVFVAPPGMVV